MIFFRVILILFVAELVAVLGQSCGDWKRTTCNGECPTTNGKRWDAFRVHYGCCTGAFKCGGKQLDCRLNCDRCSCPSGYRIKDKNEVTKWPSGHEERTKQCCQQKCSAQHCTGAWRPKNTVTYCDTHECEVNTERCCVRETDSPTPAPSLRPSHAPTPRPTHVPTKVPTARPTAAPTDVPTARPTAAPTDLPTARPTRPPTNSPTGAPSAFPTARPTRPPTNSPTGAPSAAPTNPPSFIPTSTPTNPPSGAPSVTPTKPPSLLPTTSPTIGIDSKRLVMVLEMLETMNRKMEEMNRKMEEAAMASAETQAVGDLAGTVDYFESAMEVCQAALAEESDPSEPEPKTGCALRTKKKCRKDNACVWLNKKCMDALPTPDSENPCAKNPKNGNPCGESCCAKLDGCEWRNSSCQKGEGTARRLLTAQS